MFVNWYTIPVSKYQRPLLLAICAEVVPNSGQPLTKVQGWLVKPQAQEGERPAHFHRMCWGEEKPLMFNLILDHFLQVSRDIASSVPSPVDDVQVASLLDTDQIRAWRSMDLYTGLDQMFDSYGSDLHEQGEKLSPVKVFER